MRMLSEHWEDLFAAEGEGEEEIKVLDTEELAARIEAGKNARARRCVCGLVNWWGCGMCGLIDWLTD